MNLHAMYHSPQSEYAYPVATNRAVIRFRAAAGDLAKVELVFGFKYAFGNKTSTVMNKRFSDSLYDYYENEIDTDRGRVTYYFVATDRTGKKMFYTEVGAIEPRDTKVMFFPQFQLPFVSECDILNVPEKFRNAVIYQIFPDRFYTDSPKLDWNKKPTYRDFFGGDLNGITKKLDYIKSLGVNTIYMTPIHPSSTNHHYDVEDYYRVSPDFGGEAALKTLVEAAHAKGLKIMLDGVFNHCSKNNPMFKDVVKNGRKSEYYDWFLIDGDKPVIERKNGGERCNYQTFASNIAYMPKLNGDNSKVRAFVADVMTYWIKNYGVDAWRLDVADDVSYTLWREARQAVKSADKDAILIGEDWTDANAFLGGDMFDGVMNYGFLRAVRDCFAQKTISAAQAADWLIRNYNRTNSQAAQMMMNLIGCHDTPRFFTLCNGNLFDHTAALCTMFFYDGMPMVYYGDEIPLEGGQDPDCRRGFDWTRTGGKTAELIKTLADMRAGEPAHTKMYISGEQGVLEMKRVSENKVNSLVINNSDNDIKTSMGTIARRSITVDIDGKQIEIKE